MLWIEVLKDNFSDAGEHSQSSEGPHCEVLLREIHELVKLQYRVRPQSKGSRLRTHTYRLSPRERIIEILIDFTIIREVKA